MNTDKKRRRLIQAALVAPLATSASAAGRLHGTPASLHPRSTESTDETEKFILPFVHAGMPAEELTDLAKASSLIESILTNEANANEFFTSPRQYFEAYDLDGSESTLTDPTISMLVALSAPAAKEALKRKNYNLFFNYLKSAGVFEPRDPSTLQARIQGIISENIDSIRNVIEEQNHTSFISDYKNEFISILNAPGTTATEEDIAALSYILSEEGKNILERSALLVTPAAPVFIVIAVIAAIVVLIAVIIDVFALGDGEKSPINPSSPFTGQFMKLDTTAIRNKRIAYRIAEITRDGQMRNYILRQTIQEEITATLMALSNLKLIHIPRERMNIVINALTQYTCKASGVPTHVH